MFARTTAPDQPGEPLPRDWAESLAGLLNETYAAQCVARSRAFDVYGRVYPEELLVMVSFWDKNSPHEAPLTFSLSCDPGDIATPAKVKETQELYVEITGRFFDEVFASEEWDEWEPQWQEVRLKGYTFWYKMTRENVALTLEADRLLTEAGFDPEDVDD